MAKTNTILFDNDSFKRVVMRLCQTRDTLAMSNPAGIRLLIRYNEPDEESTDFAFDVCIYTDDDCHGHVRRAIDNDMCVIDDDTDGVFVIDEFVLDKSWSPSERFDEAVELIRSLWMWRVCPCGSYFVKDVDAKYTMCLRCDLIGGGGHQKHTYTCSICYQPFDTPAAASLDCCGKIIDRKCFLRCTSCPFCRHAIVDTSSSN